MNDKSTLGPGKPCSTWSFGTGTKQGVGDPGSGWRLDTQQRLWDDSTGVNNVLVWVSYGIWDSNSRVRGTEMDGVMVFTATKAREREGLGNKVTEWLRAAPEKEIKDVQVTQSSDEEFHCLTITFLYTKKE